MNNPGMVTVIYDFLLTGTDPKGKRETVIVKAENGRDAYQSMQSRGYTDITLHTDDATVRLMQDEDVDYTEFPPDAIIRTRDLSTFGLFRYAMVDFYRRAWMLVVIVIIFLIYRRVTWQTLDFLNITAIAVLLFPPIFMFLALYLRPARKYDLMLEAFTWWRWQEVLDRIPALRGLASDFDLTSREACALAGLGRFDEAFAKINAYSDSEKIPKWMYYNSLSEIYSIVHRFEEALDCLRKAYELYPDDPEVMIILAMSLLKHQIDTPFAEQLIARAEERPMSDMLLRIMPHIKGLVALNKQRYHEAEQLFLAAEQGLHPMKVIPLDRLTVDINRAYLSIAQARLGEIEKAKKTFALASPRLKALKSTIIAKRCIEAGLTS